MGISSGAFQVLLMMFMFLSGGTENKDLLDMMSTDAYWKAKGVTVSVEQLKQDLAGGAKVAEDLPKLIQQLSAGDFATRDAAKAKMEAVGTAALPELKKAADSKDAETAAAAGELIKQISTHIRDRDIRTLMAIRTLGERKEKSALDMLKPLADSKEPFVSEYARRAMAQINGEEYKRPDRHADLLPDLALVPADAGIVGQTTGLGVPEMTMDKIVAGIVADAKDHPAEMVIPVPPGVVLPQPPRPAAPDAGVWSARLTKELIAILEQVGNVRADGVTVAVSDDVGGKKNWVMMSFRGQYDHKAVMSVIKEGSGDNDFIPFSFYSVGDMDVMDIMGEVAVVMPSDQQLVFIVADRQRTSVASVLVPLAVSLQTGKSNLDANKDLSAMVKAADKSGPAWAVGKIPPSLKRELPFLEAVETVVGATKMEKDGVAVTITAKPAAGSVADALKGTTDQIKQGIEMLIKEAGREAEQVKEIKVVVDMLKTVQVASDGGGLTLTGKVPLNIEESMLGELRREMVYMLRDFDDEKGAPDAPNRVRVMPPPAVDMPLPAPMPGKE